MFNPEEGPTPFPRINRLLLLVQDYPEGLKECLLKLAYKIKFDEDYQLKGTTLREVATKPIPSRYIQMSTDRAGIVYIFPATLSAAEVGKALALREAAQKLKKTPRGVTTGELVDAETRANIVELLCRTKTLYFNTLKDAYQLIFKSELQHECSLHQVLDSIPCIKRQALAPPAGTASEAMKREALLNPTTILSLREEAADAGTAVSGAADAAAASVPAVPTDGFEGIIPNVNCFPDSKKGNARFKRILELFLAFHKRGSNCNVELEWLDGDDDTSGVVVHGIIVAFQNDDAFARVTKESVRRALLELPGIAGEQPVEVTLRVFHAPSPFANIAIALFGHKATPMRLVSGSPRIVTLPDEHKSVVKLVHFKTPRLRLHEREREALRLLQGRKELWRKVPVIPAFAEDEDDENTENFVTKLNTA